MAKVKTFLENPTSTVTGWNKVQKKTVKALKKQNVNVKVEELNTFWGYYSRISRQYPASVVQEYKYQLMESISNDMEMGYTTKTILKHGKKVLDEAYEGGQQSYADFSTSDFFS